MAFFEMASRKALAPVVAAAVIGLFSVGAQASISTFSGQDNGVPNAGPFPVSTATEASFLAAASVLGPVTTQTFESIAVGTAQFGGSFAITGGTVTLVTPFGAPYSGVMNAVTTTTGVYGFNITSGGANWLGFAGGSATFGFTNAVNSFGFYTTGVQTDFSTEISVTFNDGTSQLLDLPINVGGGASYFGFTDDKAFSSVTITNTSNDAWGIDNVSFAAATNTVPEPATWALMIAGFGALGFAVRRRRVIA